MLEDGGRPLQNVSPSVVPILPLSVHHGTCTRFQLWPQPTTISNRRVGVKRQSKRSSTKSKTGDDVHNVEVDPVDCLEDEVDDESKTDDPELLSNPDGFPEPLQIDGLLEQALEAFDEGIRLDPDEDAVLPADIQVASDDLAGCCLSMSLYLLRKSC